jgi:phage terminase large subunit
MAQPQRVITIQSEYVPRPQFFPYHKRKQRWAALICHRRAGKTVATLNDQIKAAITLKRRDGRFAFILPFRAQAKEVGWIYLKRFAAPLLIEPPRESDLSVRLMNGSVIRLFGADNPDALRGAYFDDVVFDEFGDMHPDVWFEVVRPMLADRNGSATFIGTIKGNNAFWKLFDGDKEKNWPGARNLPDEWYTMLLKASESRILPQKELEEMRVAMGDDQYRQEMECDPNVAIKGAFYADEMRTMEAEGRIRPLSINRDIPVRTGWDVGFTDSTAITFWQCVGGERRLVDYYESSGKIITHYADVLHDKKHEHGWKYAEHYWPHDMAYHMLDSNKSRIEMMAAKGVHGEIVPAHDVLEGINCVRKMLGRTWIDPNRCKRILDALRQYHRAWDPRLEMYKPSEFRDWTNHGADSVRTFAVGFEEPSRASSGSGRSFSGSSGVYQGWGA